MSAQSRWLITEITLVENMAASSPSYDLSGEIAGKSGGARCL